MYWKKKRNFSKKELLQCDLTVFTFLKELPLSLDSIRTNACMYYAWKLRRLNYWSSDRNGLVIQKLVPHAQPYVYNMRIFFSRTQNLLIKNGFFFLVFSISLMAMFVSYYFFVDCLFFVHNIVVSLGWTNES